MQIEKIDLTELKPSPYNPRLDLKSSDSDYQKLKKSLIGFGLVDPIIINMKNKRIIGGHQRYKILKEAKGDIKLGLLRLGDIGLVFQDEDLKIENEQAEMALNLALNKISGDWNYPLLKDVLEELDTGGLEDIEITGFDEIEIEKLQTQFFVPDLTESGYQEVDESSEEIKQIFTYNDFTIFETPSQLGIPEIREDMLSEQIPSMVYVRRLDGELAHLNSLILERTDKWPENTNKCIAGYYVDDYRFEKVWHNAIEYLKILKSLEIENVITPNFSVYDDSPLAWGIWQLYRNRWISRYWQEAGIYIIPDIWLTNFRKYQNIIWEGMPQHLPVACLQIRTNTRKKGILEKYIQRLKTYLENIKIDNLIIYTSCKVYEDVHKIIPKFYKGNVYYVTSFMDRAKKKVINDHEQTWEKNDG